MQNVDYTIRDLTSEDVFPMFTIISTIGVDQFTACFDSEEVRQMMKQMQKDGVDSTALSTEVGIAVVMKIAQVLMKNLPSCKDDIYQFLSGLTGMTKKEIASLPMNTFFKMIIDVVKKDEFKDFIGVVSELFK